MWCNLSCKQTRGSLCLYQFDSIYYPYAWWMKEYITIVSIAFLWSCGNKNSVWSMLVGELYISYNSSSLKTIHVKSNVIANLGFSHVSICLNLIGYGINQTSIVALALYYGSCCRLQASFCFLFLHILVWRKTTSIKFKKVLVYIMLVKHQHSTSFWHFRDRHPLFPIQCLFHHG